MSTVDGKETFLSRWSRRKLQAKQQLPAAAPAADPPTAPPAAPSAAATTPATQATAPEATREFSAEYREYFDPRVDEKLRHIALRNLFSDPHFNVMDGLDTYIDDYSKPDPIPEAMLRQLNQAKELFLFDDEKKSADGAGDDVPAAAAGTAASLPTNAANTGVLPCAAAAGAPARDTIAAAGAATVTPEERVGND